MSLIKVFVKLEDVTAGDTGLGIDYSPDVLELSWRQVINVPDRIFFVYPSNDSIAAEALWKAIGADAASKINALLVAAGSPTLATCTFEDVMVYGFGDWKFGAPMLDVENIFTGLRERVRRIPRNLGGISQVINAQETIPLLNNEQRSLECTLQFTDAPVLGTDLEYREFLYVYPADLTDLDGLDSILLDTITTGPPYTLKGRRAWKTIHPTLIAGEQIHGVIGLRRKATLSTVTPTDAGTISRGSNSWILPSTTWTPLQVGARLKAWFAADKITGLTNGTAVTTWVESSGAGLDATQAVVGNKPIYVTNSQNSLPGVDFVSADVLATPLSASSNDETILAVIRADTLSVAAILADQTTGGRQMRIDASGHIEVRRSGFATLITSTAAITAGSAHIVGVTSLPTTAETNVNGVTSTGSHAQTYGAGLVSSLGGTNGITNPFDGRIYEVIVCNALDTVTRQYIEGYLAWKWGIQANLASTHPYKNAAPRY